MKSISRSLFLLAFAIACAPQERAKTNSNTTPVTIAQPHVDDPAIDPGTEPLVAFTGFWSLRTATSENIVKISSKESYSTKSLETQIYGLDLLSDFGYRSLALADNDNPTMDKHEGRVEALMEKTIAGKRQLIQIDLALIHPNSMTLKISGAGKTVVQDYTRLEDEADAERRFRKIQIERINDFYALGRDQIVSPDCFKKESRIEWVYKSATVACFKAMVETGNVDVNAEELLHIAARRRSLPLVKYLLSRGADVQRKNKEGRTPLEEVFESGLGSFKFPDHGMVPYTLDVDAVVGALLNQGARVDHFVLKNIVLYVDDLKILNQAIDLLQDSGDAKRDALVQFRRDALVQFIGSYQRRGLGRLQTLQKLLSKFSPIQNAEFSRDHVVNLWAISHLDPAAMETMTFAGYQFDDFSAQTQAAEERTRLERSLSDGSLRTSAEKKRLRESMAIVDKNLARLRLRN
ncbi:MAG: ankyrin repeat domain-containing protein [Bdellovibrionales bacterium]|nr:ankyrin repeat domain-containing protein [Bdellovibrionales bacterium]